MIWEVDLLEGIKGHLGKLSWLVSGFKKEVLVKGCNFS